MYLKVEITKTLKRDGVEYAHVTGTHGLAMWVPVSELVDAPKADAKAKKPAKTEEAE